MTAVFILAKPGALAAPVRIPSPQTSLAANRTGAKTGNLAAAKTATGNALRIAQGLKRALQGDEQLADDLRRLQKRVDDLAKGAPAIRPAGCTVSG